MRSRGSDPGDDGHDERREPRGKARRWGRGRSEEAPEQPEVSGEELGWIADLRTAKEQRSAIGPGDGVPAEPPEASPASARNRALAELSDPPAARVEPVTGEVKPPTGRTEAAGPDAPGSRPGPVFPQAPSAPPADPVDRPDRLGSAPAVVPGSPPAAGAPAAGALRPGPWPGIPVDRSVPDERTPSSGLRPDGRSGADPGIEPPTGGIRLPRHGSGPAEPPPGRRSAELRPDDRPGGRHGHATPPTTPAGGRHSQPADDDVVVVPPSGNAPPLPNLSGGPDLSVVPRPPAAGGPGPVDPAESRPGVRPPGAHAAPGAPPPRPTGAGDEAGPRSGSLADRFRPAGRRERGRPIAPAGGFDPAVSGPSGSPTGDPATGVPPTARESGPPPAPQLSSAVPGLDAERPGPRPGAGRHEAPPVDGPVPPPRGPRARPGVEPQSTPRPAGSGPLGRHSGGLPVVPGRHGETNAADAGPRSDGPPPVTGARAGVPPVPPPPRAPGPRPVGPDGLTGPGEAGRPAASARGPVAPDRSRPAPGPSTRTPDEPGRPGLSESRPGQAGPPARPAPAPAAGRGPAVTPGAPVRAGAAVPPETPVRAAAVVPPDAPVRAGVGTPPDAPVRAGAAVPPVRAGAAVPPVRAGAAVPPADFPSGGIPSVAGVARPDTAEPGIRPGAGRPDGPDHPVDRTDSASDARDEAPGTRSDLGQQIREQRRLRTIALLLASLLVLGALPTYFGIRAATRDPVFNSLDALAVPAWAEQDIVDGVSGSRWCLLECRFRERTMESEQPWEETARAYESALADEGWRPWKVALCPEQPVENQHYSCWRRDELTLDLWVRPPTCPEVLPGQSPATPPTEGTEPGDPAAGAAGCEGSVVSIKVRNAIADDRLGPQPTGGPSLPAVDPNLPLPDDLVPTSTPS